MRQITSWLLFIAFISVTVTLLTQKFPPSVTHKPEIPSSILNDEIVSPDLPILAYCELVNNPEKYDGKIVRLSATLYQNMHGIKFLDKNCYSEEKETAVLFNAERAEKIVDKIAQEIQAEKFVYWGEPKMIVVGKFSRVMPTRKSTSMEDNSYLHFEIYEVEKASK